jgi:hypothetical protein
MRTLGSGRALSILLAIFLPVPSQGDADADRVAEAVFRYLAGRFCTHDEPCHITVEEKRPPDSLLKRLRTVPELIPVPPGFTMPDRSQPHGFLLDVGPVKFLSDGRAQVGTTVGGIGGPQVFVCDYYLRPTPKGWRVQNRETSCAIT